ncbi:MAG: ABC transporter permease, partial [Clostridia bacterium]|nr:ABC transporter permease [Clostridia bacterium]
FGFFLDKDGESTFKWYPNDTVYKKTDASDMLYVPATQTGGTPSKAEYKYLPYSADFDSGRDTSGDVDLKVKVILQKKKGVSYGCLNTGMYYTKALTEHTLNSARESEVIKFINEKPNKQLDGMPFNYHFTYEGKLNETNEYGLKLTYYLMDSSKDMMSSMMSNMFGGGGDDYATLRVKPYMLGGGEIPVSFKIYPLDFENKDLVTGYLDGWNKLCSDGAEYKWTDADGAEQSVTLGEEDKINYNDQVGLIIYMVNTMIEMITIALVAFTALSLVVSTVMVGIITYVSVVERIKEIGILRSVGARKRDIKQLFNAETFIIGLAAGIVGVAVTYIISLILNLVLGSLYGIFTIAALPWWQAIIMVVISMVLTLISGLIPASAAAKKDPVVALRTE